VCIIVKKGFVRIIVIFRTNEARNIIFCYNHYVKKFLKSLGLTAVVMIIGLSFGIAVDNKSAIIPMDVQPRIF
jgi:hypothetical protein